MDTKNTVVAALRQLKSTHKKIRDEFAKIDDSLIEELLAKQYTSHLQEQMKKHGDGQRLFSYPRSMSELESIDAVVLFGMNFPKLGDSSEFDRSTPLHEIDYWSTTVPISPKVDSRSLHFMAWQQKVGVHGVDDKHALQNYRLLIARNYGLRSLFDKEKEAGIRFVLALEKWLSDSKKLTIVITNSIRKNFDEPILTLNLLSLNQSSHVKRIKTGLRSKNTKIMGKIGEVLIGDD